MENPREPVKGRTMTSKQRKLYGVTDEEWRTAGDRVREAMIGGRVQYLARNDRNGNNGKLGTIRKVIKTAREIEVAFDDGQAFRAFAHNVRFA